MEAPFKVEQNHKPLHPVIIAILLTVVAWLLLAPAPLPFDIAIQREMGFIGHLGLFGILTFASVAAFPRAYWLISAMLLLAAVFLEAVQFFVPTRDADPADLAMNCLGILVGLIAFRVRIVLSTRINRKTTQKA
jgi:VanZ family protein